MFIGDFILQFIPASAELLNLEKPYDRPAILFTDIDGDSVPEITAVYRLQKRTGFIVLKCIWGIWHVIANLYIGRRDMGPQDSDTISREEMLGLLRNWQDSVGLRPSVSGAVPLFPAAVMTASGNSWGYIDSSGSFRIKPQYDSAMDFQPNGLAVIQKGELSGIIDRSNSFIVKPKYNMINTFSEGRAVISDNQGFKVIDETGRVVTLKAYSYIGSYSDGRAVFSGTDAQGKYLYGYLDLQGKEVVPLRYESANDFADGKALVKVKENLYALINPAGEMLHTYNYSNMNNLGDGLLPFQKYEDSKWGYVDISGNVVIQPQYSMALPFNGGNAVVNASEADSIVNKYGLIDRKGHYIIKPLYNDIEQLGEGKAAVGKAVNEQEPYLGSRFAIADEAVGSLLTDFIYTGVEKYNQGYASATDGISTFFIDSTGKKAKDLPIASGSGTLSFDGSLIKANVDLQQFYMSRDGKVVWQPNTVISLDSQYEVLREKYKPNKDYLVYYPQISGMKNSTVQRGVNSRLKELSGVKPIDGNVQLDYSYTGDFSVKFFRESLLVFELMGYNFPFGAAHGMPTDLYTKIDLTSGRFYELKDLFKPDTNYVKVLGDIIGNQIKTNPKYDYVFPDSYKGIAADQPFYVDEAALYIYFAPYEIAPYAAGFPTFRIPYREIMPIINTEGDFWKAFH